MKKNILLTTLIALTGMTQGVQAAADKPSAYQSESFGSDKFKSKHHNGDSDSDRASNRSDDRKKKNDKPVHGKTESTVEEVIESPKDTKETKPAKDTKSSHTSKAAPTYQTSQTTPSAPIAKGMKGDKGERGDRGARGEKGEKGETGVKGEKGEQALAPTPVYGYYYQVGTVEIEPKGPVNFVVIGTEAGGILADPTNGGFIVPEKGHYQITFSLSLQGNSAAAFGVQVNNKKVLPGSIFKSQNLSNTQDPAPLTGTLIACLEQGDNIRVVNVSTDAFQLNGDYISPPSHNASFFIKKLN